MYISFAVWTVCAIWDLVGWAKKTTRHTVSVIFLNSWTAMRHEFDGARWNKAHNARGVEMGKHFSLIWDDLREKMRRNSWNRRHNAGEGQGKKPIFINWPLFAHIYNTGSRGGRESRSNGKFASCSHALEVIHSKETNNVPRVNQALSCILGREPRRKQTKPQLL